LKGTPFNHAMTSGALLVMAKLIFSTEFSRIYTSLSYFCLC
jgi:hypothetical protein